MYMEIFQENVNDEADHQTFIYERLLCYFHQSKSNHRDHGNKDISYFGTYAYWKLLCTVGHFISKLIIKCQTVLKAKVETIWFPSSVLKYDTMM